MQGGDVSWVKRRVFNEKGEEKIQYECTTIIYQKVGTLRNQNQILLLQVARFGYKSSDLKLF